MRAELRGLSPEQAEIVGAHLLMAGQLMDSDPALAYRHAEAARRRAARLPVTREAAGETAYAAGEYAIALAEFRALRRMTGNDDFLAAMADCERALGNPDKALKLVKEGLRTAPDLTARVELRLVEAGCRLDLDQADEALRVLRQELESGGARGTRESRIRLRYGYANLLELTGNADEAERWFAAAAAMDTENTTDAADRVAALQGLVLEVDEDDLVGDERTEQDTDDEDDEDAESGEDDEDAESGEDDEDAESGEDDEDAESDEADEDFESDEDDEDAESDEDDEDFESDEDDEDAESDEADEDFESDEDDEDADDEDAESDEDDEDEDQLDELPELDDLDELDQAEMDAIAASEQEWFDVTSRDIDVVSEDEAGDAGEKGER